MYSLVLLLLFPIRFYEMIGKRLASQALWDLLQLNNDGLPLLLLVTEIPRLEIVAIVNRSSVATELQLELLHAVMDPTSATLDFAFFFFFLFGV